MFPIAGLNRALGTTEYKCAIDYDSLGILGNRRPGFGVTWRLCIFLWKRRSGVSESSQPLSTSPSTTPPDKAQFSIPTPALTHQNCY
jgi:hypothetical protein